VSDQSQPSRISRIEVEKLFGYYSYILPSSGEEKDVSTFFILYGDNGSGKTTILNLVYAMMLSEDRVGAKTYISKTPFGRVSIFFDNGSEITALRTSGLMTGAFTIIVNRIGEEPFCLEITPDNDGGVRQDMSSLHSVMTTFDLSVRFLPDDRRTSSPFATPSRRGGFEHLPDGRIVVRGPETGEQSHHLNVEPILKRVTEAVRRRALRSTNQGEGNATTIYQNVISRIADMHPLGHGEPPQPIDELVERIKEIGNSTAEYARYGLIAPISADKFLAPIERASPDSQDLIGTVLRPFVEGIEARTKALKSVKDLMARFVETARPLLHPKQILFSIESGLQIFDRNGSEIQPNLLSSGEKQLILIFCHSLLIGSKRTIFIIDEPELSLNIKWQRHLLHALTEVSGRGGIQFLLATHSLDLLAKHRSSTVHLIDQSEYEEGEESENEEENRA